LQCDLVAYVRDLRLRDTTRAARRADGHEGLDALFLAPSADLEYLTGVERQIPFFAEISYAHGWVTGAFFRPGREPIFLFPRMFATLDLHEEPEGEIVVVNETDDGVAAFERVVRGFGGAATIAVGDRVWAETVLNLGHAVGFEHLRTGSRLVNVLRRVKTTAELEAMGRAIAAVERTMAAVTPLVIPGVTMAELVESVEHELREASSRCPSFPTHIFTGIAADDYDSGLSSGRTPIRDGTSVMFDFGGVVDGSDFGRTIYCGEPPGDYLEAYEIMLAAQEAGRAAAGADTPAHEVNAACRAPIEAAGLGPHFRHRMGHCIGMDVHERPFISEEDETPLQPGMAFTDEPSLIIPGRYSLRIEDILVCEEGGGRKLNAYPTALVSGSAEGGA
jgi:Xaa-Pro aminopeptidase